MTEADREALVESVGSPKFGQIQLIESEQRTECADCGRTRKVYAVQGMLLMDFRTNKLEHTWQPTCRKCTREILKQRQEDNQ